MSTSEIQLVSENQNFKTAVYNIEVLQNDIEDYNSVIQNIQHSSPRIDTIIFNKNKELEEMISKLRMMKIDIQREFNNNILPDELDIHKNNIGPINPAYSVIGKLPSKDI